MTTEKQAHINTCLNNFRFDKVHLTMVCLDWGWASTNMKPPGVYDLIEKAKTLLSQAWDERATIETGGLRAIYHPGGEYDGVPYSEGLELLFIVAEAFSDEY